MHFFSYLSTFLILMIANGECSFEESFNKLQQMLHEAGRDGADIVTKQTAAAQALSTIDQVNTVQDILLFLGKHNTGVIGTGINFLGTFHALGAFMGDWAARDDASKIIRELKEGFHRIEHSIGTHSFKVMAHMDKIDFDNNVVKILKFTFHAVAQLFNFNDENARSELQSTFVHYKPIMAVDYIIDHAYEQLEISSKGNDYSLSSYEATKKKMLICFIEAFVVEFVHLGLQGNAVNSPRYVHAVETFMAKVNQLLGIVEQADTHFRRSILGGTDAEYQIKRIFDENKKTFIDIHIRRDWQQEIVDSIRAYFVNRFSWTDFFVAMYQHGELYQCQVDSCISLQYGSFYIYVLAARDNRGIRDGQYIQSVFNSITSLPDVHNTASLMGQYGHNISAMVVLTLTQGETYYVARGDFSSHYGYFDDNSRGVSYLIVIMC